jgi:hypothetical protein
VRADHLYQPVPEIPARRLVPAPSRSSAGRDVGDLDGVLPDRCRGDRRAATATARDLIVMFDAHRHKIGGIGRAAPSALKVLIKDA